MSQQTNPSISIVGIDIGKDSFHVVGLDQRGAIVLRQSGRIDGRSTDSNLGSTRPRSGCTTTLAIALANKFARMERPCPRSSVRGTQASRSLTLFEGRKPCLAATSLAINSASCRSLISVTHGHFNTPAVAVTPGFGRSE
jgi:hypothetical protein